MSTTTNNNDNDFWENFQDSISQENNEKMNQNHPTSFLETISPDSNPTRYDNLAKELFQITQLSDQSKTIPFLEESNMSILTIATGFNKEIHHVHHFFETGTGNTDLASFALFGKRPKPEIQAKKNLRLSTQAPFHTVRMASHIDQHSNTSDTGAGEASDSQSLRNLQIPCTYGNRAFGNIRLRESHLTVSTPTHQYQ